jgi:replicative superfamily II helicase
MEAGKPKTTDKRIIIATWNMLMRQPKEWFDSVDVFICDEAHQADSMALSKIIAHLTQVIFRFRIYRHSRWKQDS